MTMTAVTVGEKNTSLSALRTWLARRPTRARELVLRATAGTDRPDVVVNTWPAEEVVPALAVEILEQLDDHAEQVAQSVDATLSFIDGDGVPLKVKPLKRSHGAVHVPESLGDVALDASTKSQIVQLQAFCTSMMQQMLRSNATVIQQSVELCKHQAMVTRSLAEELASLRGRYKASNAEVDGLREALERAPQVEAEGGLGKLVELLQPHLPMVLQLAHGMLSAPAAPPAPALVAKVAS